MTIDREGVVETISVVFFAREFKDLPICQRIGDVIRVHRAQVGAYNGKKQISVNVCFNSSWAMFAPQVYGSAPSKTVNEESKAVEEVWSDE
jgi:hypothetical protein